MQSNLHRNAIETNSCLRNSSERPHEVNLIKLLGAFIHRIVQSNAFPSNAIKLDGEAAEICSDSRPEADRLEVLMNLPTADPTRRLANDKGKVVVGVCRKLFH